MKASKPSTPIHNKSARRHTFISSCNPSQLPCQGSLLQIWHGISQQCCIPMAISKAYPARVNLLARPCSTVQEQEEQKPLAEAHLFQSLTRHPENRTSFILYPHRSLASLLGKFVQTENTSMKPKRIGLWRHCGDVQHPYKACKNPVRSTTDPCWALIKSHPEQLPFQVINTKHETINPQTRHHEQCNPKNPIRPMHPQPEE